MQNVFRTLVIGGAVALAMAAFFLSGSVATSPWMGFFLLSAIILILVLSTAFRDAEDEKKTGSTAGVLSDGKVNIENTAFQQQSNDGLPDPLEDGFDLPL
jgi:hypothetical protein